MTERKDDNPTLFVSPNIQSGVGLTSADNSCSSKHINSSENIIRIKRDVFEHLPRFYQQTALYFKEAGEVMIEDD